MKILEIDLNDVLIINVTETEWLYSLYLKIYVYVL